MIELQVLDFAMPQTGLSPSRTTPRFTPVFSCFNQIDAIVTHPEPAESSHSEPSPVIEPESIQTSNQTGAEHQLSGAAAERTNPELSREIAMAAAKVAAENRGTDIVVLDMSKQTAIFDYFVIITGSSRRQLHAISEEIDNKLEKELKEKRMNIDGYDQSRWIVLDYGTVVIHLFDEETRQFYSLESLWGDATKIEVGS